MLSTIVEYLYGLNFPRSESREKNDNFSLIFEKIRNIDRKMRKNKAPKFCAMHLRVCLLCAFGLVHIHPI